MAHELDNTTGEYAYFGVATPAWHKLGKTIAAAVTSDEAVKLACLDWLVDKQEIFLANGQRVPDNYAIVRSDSGGALGVVGTDYVPFQNAQAFDFMDSLVGDKLAMFETGGAIKGGRRVWMMARIPTTHRIAGNDTLQPYMLITNSHDGTSAIRVFPTSVRVVCNNTLTLAMREAGGKAGISIRHEGDVGRRVNAARHALGVIAQSSESFADQARAMARRSLNSRESRDYFESLFPVSLKHERRATPHVGATHASSGLLDSILAQHADSSAFVGELIEAHYATSERQAKANRKILDAVLGNYENERNRMPGIEHSAWAAYNAVSEWADHQRGSRGRTEAERLDNQLNSIWFGSANEIKQTAYANALALTT